MKNRIFSITVIVAILAAIGLIYSNNFTQTNFERGVVVSKSPQAAEVGAKILSQGGNAFDAAVATGYALGVAEAEGSGIGGGGFALLYIAKTGELKAIDFRERAPKTINTVDYELTLGPKAAGIPGTVAGFRHIRENYGNMNTKQVLKPVIELARNGFPVSQKLLTAINLEKDKMKKYNPDYEVFYPNGEIPKLHQHINRPYMAKTLEILSEKGEQDFYNGGLAELIVSEMSKRGGLITLEDLQGYKVYEERPICGTYRGKNKVCSFPLPSSGGVCIIEALNILENFNFSGLEYNSPERLHILIETLKYAFKDRALGLGDARFADISVEKYVSKPYAKAIAEKIKASETATPSAEINTGNEKPETTHYTVIDRWGNIAAVTVSLNGRLGSKFGISGTGIIMNNTMDDFSIDKPNQFLLVGNRLNAPEPGKTPLSSMSPTIVFDKDGKPVLALGSPGGPTIINAVLQVILAFIDYDMPINEAIQAGRLHHQWQPDLIFAEPSLVDEKTRKILEEKYNHKFPEHDNYIWSDFYWFVQAVELDNRSHRLTGASDSRTEGGVSYEER